MDALMFMKEVTNGLRAAGNSGTAHVYRSCLNAIKIYHGKGSLAFDEIIPQWLKGFEIHLRNRKCSWNTVSTYMRTLRAVYNRAVDRQMADYIPRQFHTVYTGTRAEHQCALESDDMKKVFSEVPDRSALPPSIQRARHLFILMFLMRGMPFVDLVYLRKSDLNGNVITYRRRKTGRALSVTLTDEAAGLLRRYMRRDTDSPYLLPFLKSREGTEEAYKEYQLALRKFNRQLAILSKLLKLSDRLNSYAARHTWATTTYHCEIHPGIISEAMGHSSITVTETYLKPFRHKRIDEANNQIIDFVKRNIGLSIG